MPNTPLTGLQYDIAAGPYTATVASVGASLRQLRYHDRDLIVPFGLNEVRPAFRGAVLAPWPNRVIAGRYRFGDADMQLALTEPERGNALHGLLYWQDWRLVSHTDSAVVLSAIVQPQSGYPFRLEVIASYTLSEAGLTTTVSALNLSRTDAPYGTAAHPYLIAGSGRVDDWDLEMPAATVFLTTPDTLAPTKLVAVDAPFDGGPMDFRTPRRIGTQFIDHAFSGLGEDDTVTLRLRASDGGVQMTWSPVVCPWVQIHTADRPEPETSRIGLAVEPMTCPPDAFNSGIDLIVLPRGGTHTAEWTIAALTI